MKKWFKEIDNMRMFVNKPALKKCNKILGNVMKSRGSLGTRSSPR